jgi:colicin import membrane protein
MRIATLFIFFWLIAGCAAPPSQKPVAGATSDSYAARVGAAVRRNIVLREELLGNPMAEVEVRLDTGGEILNIRLVTSSRVASWDKAVIDALKRTERLPLDIDGRVPARMMLAFRPR